MDRSPFVRAGSRFPSLLLLIFLLLTVACGQAAPTPLPEPSPSATLKISSPTPSLTALPATATLSPTPVIIAGVTTALVNVRSGPGTEFAALGTLASGEPVEVELQSEDGLWLRILYPSAPDGHGWVSAPFIRLTSGSTVPRDVTPTPEGPIGYVLIRLNVRSGPGTSFESLGMLEAETQVILLAKNAVASWFQIEYPAGTEKTGWVTAQYIQTSLSSVLPVVDEFGAVISTGTPGPSPIPVIPSPTLGPAPEDGDSNSLPAVSVIFSATGTRSFTYSSLVSNPGGDGEDWLEFTPFATLPGAQARLLASLSCLGNGSLRVELWKSGALFTGWGSLACGDSDRSLSLLPGGAYQLRLLAEPGDGLQLVLYTLRLENLP